MKIIWLGQREHILPWLTDLRHVLSGLCEVVAYGDGEEFIHEYNVETIVKKEEPDVIMIGSNQYKFKNLDKVKIPKAIKCADPWVNIWNHIKFIKDNNVDLILMNYKCATPEYQKYLPDKKFGWLPHAVNPVLFKNLGLKRKIDLMYVASQNNTYPLRVSLYHEIPYIEKVKTFISEPHTLSFDEYVRKINQSKIFAFGNVNRKVGDSKVLVFAMAKIYEVMACETLCMMDKPDMVKELHFFPDVNFIEINKDNLKEKVKYWINHNKRRRKIAEAGYETVMKYHTVEIRSKQLYDKLEKLT